MESKTFCVLPWVHLGTKPDGTLNLCCFASHVVLKDEKGKPFRLDTDPIEDVWNGHDLRNVRKGMLEGKNIRGCEVCYMDEAVGKRSLRQNRNEHWQRFVGKEEIEKRVDESLKNDGAVLSPALYLDLRLGNKCNLKCRMCFPINSHGLNNEIAEIIESGEEFPEMYRDMLLNGKAALDWGDSENFHESLRKVLPFVRELYFTGGEPTLIAATKTILKMACELGVASQIQLNFHTNTTVWNQELVNLLPNFHEAIINCSIDGVEGVDEFVRYPTRFSAVEANFKKYLEVSLVHPNVKLSIGTTVSWMNIFELPRLARWYAEYARGAAGRLNGIYFGLVYFPGFLKIEMVPRPLRPIAIKAAKEALEFFRTENLLVNDMENGLTAIIRILEQAESYTLRDSEDLVNLTRAMNSKRGQDLAQLIPSANAVFEHHTLLLNHFKAARSLERP